MKPVFYCAHYDVSIAMCGGVLGAQWPRALTWPRRCLAAPLPGRAPLCRAAPCRVRAEGSEGRRAFLPR
eukprot:6185187-Pleurochrysis_carterae.AAC.2